MDGRKILLGGIGILFASGVVVGNFSSAYAEPYLAVREGYKCSQCHTNRTGGGKRNEFGVLYSQTTLPLIKAAPVEEEDKEKKPVTFLDRLRGELFDPKLNDHISLGTDLRVNENTRFLSGANTSGFSISEGNIYVEANLVGEFLTAYFDETLAPGGAGNREALILIENLPLNSYVKAGNMLLPYGFRILDDTSFIRQVTGFNYDNSDLGIEAGLEPGPLSFVIAVSNGTQGAADSNVDKQVSTRAEGVFRHWRVGGSFSWNEAPGTTRYVYGGFTGGTWGRFTLLGEVDWVKDTAAAGDIDQLVAFGELNILLLRGLNLKGTYDFHDPDRDIPENERARWSGGVEVFITQFLQTSLSYRFNEDIPQNAIGNADELLFEIHAFF